MSLKREFVCLFKTSKTKEQTGDPYIQAGVLDHFLFDHT